VIKEASMPTLIRALILFNLLFISACGQPVNSPYPASDAGKSILYSAFGERPKHLDPARSYSENEYVFLGNIYEPPLQYHYLKRPYQLEPQTAAAMPTCVISMPGSRIAGHAEVSKIAISEYEIRIKPGIRYQPHPAFAQDAQGKPRLFRSSRKNWMASIGSRIFPRPVRVN
jgi:oligopeptide transport system substrate-binding protein